MLLTTELPYTTSTTDVHLANSEMNATKIKEVHRRNSVIDGF